MIDHTIKSKDCEIQFRGELIAQDDCTVTFEDEHSYCMLVKAYAVEGGGYVSSLECQSPKSDEDPYLVFEEIDLLQDVENFFYVFESEDIFGEGMEALEDDHKLIDSRLKSLSTQYEKMVFKFLDQLHAEAAARRHPRQNKTDTFGKHVLEEAWDWLGNLAGSPHAYQLHLDTSHSLKLKYPAGRKRAVLVTAQTSFSLFQAA